MPPSGGRSTSPSPLEACLEAEEAGLPLQVILTPPEAPNLKSKEPSMEPGLGRPLPPEVKVEEPKEELEAAATGEAGLSWKPSRLSPLSPRPSQKPLPRRACQPGCLRSLWKLRCRWASLLPTHTLTPVLLTPSSLPPSIHFWSTLSPTAPRT